MIKVDDLLADYSPYSFEVSYQGTVSYIYAKYLGEIATLETVARFRAELTTELEKVIMKNFSSIRNILELPYDTSVFSIPVDVAMEYDEVQGAQKITIDCHVFASSVAHLELYSISFSPKIHIETTIKMHSKITKNTTELEKKMILAHRKSENIDYVVD